MSTLRENVRNCEIQPPEPPFTLNNQAQPSLHLDYIHLSTQDINSTPWNLYGQQTKNPKHNNLGPKQNKPPKPSYQNDNLFENTTQNYPIVQLGLKSPMRLTSPHKVIYSPIKTSNTFGPLLKPNKPKASSSSILGSSSCSRPLFPPRFENTIPTYKKRAGKKKKKKT